MNERDIIGKIGDTTFELKLEKPKYQSKIVIDNFTVFLEKKFNWFNRLMIKLVFGIKIEKCGDDNENI